MALTLPKMSADPVDDTNALLLELIRGNNETALSLTLPSAKFSPTPHIYTINFLFLVSLASALFASFFAVVGKQWLAYYQTPEGSGGDKQRGEQLKRSQGAERWRLIPILDGLIPLLLQFALIELATAGNRTQPLEIVVKEVGDQLMWKLPLQRKADPPAQLQGDFVRRILAVSADREAVFHAALNIHIIRDPRTIRRIVDDGVTVARLRELFMDLERTGPVQLGQRLPITMGRDAIAFGGAVLQLTLYGNSSSPANLDPNWSPETMFQSSTGFASLLLAEGSEKNQSVMAPLPASYSIMKWLWEAWSEDQSPGRLLTFKTAASLLPPLPLQTTAFIALSLSVSRGLEVVDPSWTFPSWSSSLFPDIQDVFWKKEMDDDLTDIICNALETCTRYWDRKPSLQVYIALLKGVAAQVRQAELSNDVYYLRPIIRAIHAVSLYTAWNIVENSEDPLESLEPELWLPLKSEAFNAANACLEHSIAALRPGLDDETSGRHQGNIFIIISQVGEYLDTLLDGQPGAKFDGAEALRALDPLLGTISGKSLSKNPGLQGSVSKNLIKDVVDKYHSMKRAAERNIQTARLVSVAP
ncbi:hypothetical protein FRC05_000943 [Tulasnella sp. 425]|nr:hypothetical protein FRC05_000943 [Tulasnella sp. 425]